MGREVNVDSCTSDQTLPRETLCSSVKHTHCNNLYTYNFDETLVKLNCGRPNFTIIPDISCEGRTGTFHNVINCGEGIQSFMFSEAIDVYNSVYVTSVKCDYVSNLCLFVHPNYVHIDVGLYVCLPTASNQLLGLWKWEGQTGPFISIQAGFMSRADLVVLHNPDTLQHASVTRQNWLNRNVINVQDPVDHIVNIIDELCDRQDCTLTGNSVEATAFDDHAGPANGWPYTEDVNPSVVAIPKREQPMFPSDTRGIKLRSNTDWSFIGPDKEPVAINSIDIALDVAAVIKNSGVPNYQAARIPIVSDLNLAKWRDILTDFPYPKLLDYLTFGFPLSLRHPDSLVNKHVKNHFSAIQYPDQVKKYIDKELSHGAILGPLFGSPPKQAYFLPCSLDPRT